MATDFSTGGIPLLVWDVETAPMDNAADFIQPGQPPANYSKPESIAKWQAEDRAAQLEAAALNPDLAQIVTVAYYRPDADFGFVLSRDQYSEAAMLTLLADLIGPATISIGFNNRFDVMMARRRALYLGLPFPAIGVDKYRHPGLIDLQDVLSFDGTLSIKGKSLDFYKRRFGLDVPADAISGKDVPRLYAEGTPEAWQAIRRHCELDVLATRLLAQRLGVIGPLCSEAF